MSSLLTKEQLLAALSDAALTSLNSKQAFARGHAYANSGVVNITEQSTNSAPSVRALVRGTHDYSVQLHLLHEEGAGFTEIDGGCTCPNGLEGWFCKHQIATALVWRAMLEGKTIEIDQNAAKKVQASQKRAQTQAANRLALHDFIRTQPSQVLAEKLIDLSEESADIARDLQAWRKIRSLSAHPADTKDLITEMLAVRGSFLDYHRSNEYAHHAAKVIALLESLRRSDEAIDLHIHALKRIWAALEKADDSGGSIGEVAVDLMGAFCQCLKVAGPQPASFGDTFFKLVLAEPMGLMDSQDFDDALGADALERYYKLTASKWRQLKDQDLATKAAAQAAAQASVAKGKPVRTIQSWSERTPGLFSLENLHLSQLKRQGDINAMIAVHRQSLDEPFRYIKLAQLLEEHKRSREAFALIEQGLKAFPDDARIRQKALFNYEQDGWSKEAYAIRQGDFDRYMSLEGYLALIKAAPSIGKKPDKIRAALLEQVIAQESNQSKHISYVNLRAKIFLHENRWDDLLELIARPKHYIAADLIMQIALDLPQTYREASLKLLQQSLDQNLERAQSPYTEALALAKQIVQRLPSAMRAIWLNDLKIRYKARRNLVAGLALISVN